jgi:hypothetical protein
MTTLRELELRASGPRVPGTTDRGYPPSPRLLAFAAALAAAEPVEGNDHGNDDRNRRELRVSLMAKFGTHMSAHAGTEVLRTGDWEPTLAGHEFDPTTGDWSEPVGSIAQVVEVREIASGHLEGYVLIRFAP